MESAVVGKGSKDDVAERRRREKKRAQNRNSQKLSRERQASYIRGLEHIVNKLDVGSPGSAQTPSQLLEIIEQLRTENRELRDLVLRMRKRFMSLSTTASSSADECILDSTVGRGESDGNPEAESNSLPAGFIAPAEQSVPLSSSSQVSPWSVPVPCADGDDMLLRHESNLATSTTQNLPDNITPALLSLSTKSASKEQTFPGVETYSNIFSYLSCTVTHGVQKIFHMESSVRKVMAEMEEIGGVSDERFSQVLGSAVRLLLKQSPLEGFIDALGFPHYMESIIRWRLAPTSANREKVPHPFTPTVLQQHCIARHPYIDFIPWSELRDQVLLYMGQLDVGQLFEDLISHYVQDVPELNVAFPLFDTYCEVLQRCTADVNQSLSGEILGVSEDSQCTVFYSVISICRKYALDKYAERRLDPAFKGMYPLLDVEKIVTKLPVLSYAVAFANKS